MTARLHPDVLAVGRDFKVVGMSTPGSVAYKGELLFQPNEEGERVAVVIADAIRCSSTILAAFGAGVAAATVTPKGSNQGVSLAEAERVSEALNLNLILGGELFGRPIPGGKLVNSPRAASAERLDGTLLHFHCTNLGTAFFELSKRAAAFQAAGGFADIYLGSFVNVGAIAARIRADSYSRLFVATGGFYEMLSFEDLVFAGELLACLGLAPDEMDDEARTMLACNQVAASDEERLDAFQTNWIGRWLIRLGKGADIGAIVCNEGVNPEVVERMRKIVPFVAWIADVPVFLPKVIEIDSGLD